MPQAEETDTETPSSAECETQESDPELMEARLTEEKSPKLENSLSAQYEEKVRPCIDLIDSLRALGVEQDLALPAIAVIGDQSSGKSSVLEALSGVALPRGSGIVTRCPLVLRLKKLVGKDAKWTGTVSYLDKEIELQDASEVEGEIRKAQNVIAGEGVGISQELISLRVSSPHVPDLTLIDLPGITRVAVGGQPADIGYQIKRLIGKYISKEQTINLVVVPCNVDIATTEALSMAREVDPEGDRTIGILTKPDLVDRGTEDKVVDVVENLVYHLKKGYTIVRCRGQQDIQAQLGLATALEKEKLFFQEHPQFRRLLEEGRATIPCLAEKLTSELIMHICKSLPTLENQIKEMHQKASDELQMLGTEVPDDENEKTFFLISKINVFNQAIQALVQGEEAVEAHCTRLFTKVRFLFQGWSLRIEENFKNSLLSIQREISRFERQYRGRELPGFVNYKTFEIIVREQISALEEPAVDMLQKATDIIQLAFADVAKKNFEEFLCLFKASKAKMEDLKQELLEEAERMIRLHFQMERMVHCHDGSYRAALQKVRQEEAEEEERKKKGGTVQSQSQSQSQPSTSMEEIVQHLQAYHEETSRRLSTHVPLLVRYFMLHTLAQRLQEAMLLLLQDREGLGQLLQERWDTSAKRKFLKERLSRLSQARRRLAQFAD
ncbi:interferon-induced GTP-binding protein Mx1 [Sorex araneus]|uniref:interferon-induced GTP-binding protein Mx1 n=1 Tax=Sorex araneus TaxID=42254 RepID=UPI0024333FB1|nr:interferon-induced GTP-binding protein Mx1 [Sorex araneus]XP_054983878.1 interferon-induced GTP-binding protein Mx1 [Sorex araneus]XP_054983879.1 interferon-induced GTP-binding protein Mx1 [Sorex araneus]XP_054983880.1 interferon-induced GTP-binding protein Mx1 [Sorex araneus]XP_054983881.1 interferon-induced GTP-binding protein Mx1 [Sorex araneus]XP_054983882.1 interferon-induced GTP-binding protein Mx1 [Sorex araneus]XP_054983883.1 interferon-induced GTP-binding protein Mx1 [Sorex araneu